MAKGGKEKGGAYELIILMLKDQDEDAMGGRGGLGAAGQEQHY
jgi:hypothetical protein